MNSEDKTGCIEVTEIDVCLCPLEGMIHTISKKWTLQIVAMIGNHSCLRYNELEKMLSGISPTVLADRLKILEENRFISRKVYAEVPPRVEYSLTKDGKELREMIVPLMNWAAKRNK